MAIIISIFGGLLIFCILVILLYKRGIDYDMINKRLYNISFKQKNVDLDEDLNKSLYERFAKQKLEYVIKLLTKHLPKNTKNTKKDDSLRKILRQAGMIIMPNEYLVIRMIVITTISIIFVIIGLLFQFNIITIVFMALFGVYASYTVMRFNLMSRIKKRKERLESQMPDVLDMISVNVEAGLAFEQAMSHVINNFKGPLLDELNICYREMTMGRSRRDALVLLGERCDIDDMKSFTGAVIQAGKMGISLKNVLRTQAAAIRQNRRNKVEERAMKISIKMLLPMVLFIFPVIFIVLLGPAVIKIIEMFGGM
ncbi:tight adherence protein C [Sedimentibacter acidaminivorans]|uniref:Tight adherence protein C n=1 Tax=Sedimentibacter acidaminivorans TaxID=913099 RepID=A0ABS4GB98_9FIRM|nr:type II secretion system F family protein [Sedimentibacter acidaminivorans]MBP1924807.1 tight adherence protein C [Sedimentibacter acidaminivorans]